MTFKAPEGWIVVRGRTQARLNEAMPEAINGGLPIVLHRADWLKYGRAAGHIRNAEMAAAAEAVVLFPGGSGTASMRKEAVKRGLLILEGR